MSVVLPRMLVQTPKTSATRSCGVGKTGKKGACNGWRAVGEGRSSGMSCAGSAFLFSKDQLFPNFYSHWLWLLIMATIV